MHYLVSMKRCVNCCRFGRVESAHTQVKGGLSLRTRHVFFLSLPASAATFAQTLRRLVFMLRPNHLMLTVNTSSFGKHSLFVAVKHFAVACVYDKGHGQLRLLLGAEPEKKVINNQCVECFNCSETGMRCMENNDM